MIQLKPSQYLSIAQSLEMLEKLCSVTNISAYSLRKLVEKAEVENIGINIFPAGRKKLIQTTSLFRYLKIPFEEID